MIFTLYELQDLNVSCHHFKKSCKKDGKTYNQFDVLEKKLRTFIIEEANKVKIEVNVVDQNKKMQGPAPILK